MKRVVVIDDSITYRRILSSTIEEIPDVRLSGQGRDGLDGLDKIESLRPDIVTLDVEMPRLNGLDTLKEIKKRWPDTIVVMISSLTKQGAKETIEALEIGAFSFVKKPESTADLEKFKQSIKTVFSEISAYDKRIVQSTIVRRPPTPRATPRQISKPELITIGISTGGPSALMQVIPYLDPDIPVPILIVQHMPKGFTTALANSLNAKSKVMVKEASHEEIIQRGCVYIAPGGRQMGVRRRVGNLTIHLTDDPAENYCKPAADYLFRSVSENFKGSVLAIVMTGMGSDGAKGLKVLKEGGASSIGQNAETCTVYGMPREAMKAGVIDRELPLNEIAPEINRLTKNSR